MRRFDRKVVALGVALVFVVLVILLATSSGVRDVLLAWVDPPEVTAEQRQAEAERDAAQAETRAALEKRLPVEDAWDVVEAYGLKRYPEGFSINNAGTIWETAVDADTWDLRSTCHYVQDGVGYDRVCRAIVDVTSGNAPEVTSFTLE